LTTNFRPLWKRFYWFVRLLVYADLQATDGADLCYLQPNVSLQHYRIRKFFEDLRRVYAEHQCDGIVDLGDTTDDRSSIPISTLDVLCEGMTELPGSKYKITGNHEQLLRNASVSNWRLFAPYFTVIHDRKMIRIGDCSVWFCSYPADHAELAHWIASEAAAKRSKKILFGHFQVKGAYLTSARAATGIPLEVLSAFDMVLLGHIHSPQSLTKTVHYVGSPFQQDWGEAGQAKRVAILDTESMKLTWVPLTGYPEYREVGLKQFQAESGQLTEHRYRVSINSHVEAEEFFAHPAFSRAVGVYNYDTSSDTGAAPEVRDWSFGGTLERYMAQVPHGLEVSDAEMLEAGKLVSSSD
jgi:Calcineurin-like phosphoesterase